ncbi:MAG: NHL repeat-containing protein [Pseudomonadota bacterium]
MYLPRNYQTFLKPSATVKKLILSGIAVLIFQSSLSYAGTQVYTLNADFDLGEMEGVDYSVPDQLQLSTEPSVLPFIWVANSGESTVSKIDTETGCELGRYRTGPGTGWGENPSRTTVDINGDLWVGNRGSNTATKIALYPTDLDNNGVVTTSEDSDGNCLIEGSELLNWGEDEAILLRIDVDSGPRALAIDADNNVWIGGYGKNMGYYNGETGEELKNIHIGRYCYGALIDSKGTLWISNSSKSSLTRIDDPSGAHTMTFIPTGDGWVYGISIDQDGYIYTSAWGNNRLRKYDPVNKTWVYSVSIPGGSSGRGVAVGLDGDIWVANSGTDRVTRHDAADGSLIATIIVGDQPTGVATAADGKIWVTNLSSNNVMRIDPDTNAVDFTQEGHPGPYNYSDMTGIISRNITTKVGTWTVVYDEGSPSICQAVVSWNDEQPADSTIFVIAQSSVDGVSWEETQQVQSGVAFPTVENAAYIEVMVEFTASTEEQLTPILYDLTVETEACNHPPIALCEDQVVSANSQCVANASIDAGSYDPDGMPWFITESPTSPFPLGITDVDLTITDPFGEVDACSATVTVEDNTPPVVEMGDMLEMWPPNHKYRSFTLSDCVASVTDNCSQSIDPNVAGSIVSIYSDEPEDVGGNGDGKTFDDIVIVSNSEFKLRSERQGKGNGRVYGINFVMADEAGNTTEGTCLIGVPHDQDGQPPINDGPGAGYTVP